MPLTTSELFRKIIAHRNWYNGIGIDRLLAAKTKENFNAGKLSEAKQTEILLKLGYKINSPQLWNESLAEM
jgi:hypothetical protein